MRKVLWWLYLAVMALNIVWLLVSEPSHVGSWVYAALGAVGLVGLAGYIANTQYGPRLLWQAVFAGLLAVNVVLVAKAVMERQSDLLFAGVAFAALLMLPWFFALWRYAFSLPDGAARVPVGD